MSASRTTTGSSTRQDAIWPAMSRPHAGYTSGQRLAHVQDLHGIGAADGVVAVAFGEDDPVALLHHATLEQFVHRCLADLLRRQVGRVEGNGLYAAEQRHAGDRKSVVYGKRVERHRH